MITDTLAQCHRYTNFSTRFAAAFDFLQKLSTHLPDGRHDIEGDDCFALAQTYVTRPLAQAKFEAHRRYIDIQFIQSGSEAILWAPFTALTETTQPYTEEKDVAFYANPPCWTPIHLRAGQFSIFFPEDGHAPCIESDGPTETCKIVIKIRI